MKTDIMQGVLLAFISYYPYISAIMIINNIYAAKGEQFYITKNTGYRRVYNISEKHQVLNPIECALHCMNHGCCTSFNLQAQQLSKDPWNCEILGEIRNSHLEMLERNSEYSFYEAFEKKCANGGQCQVNSSNGFGYSCVCPCRFTGRRCEEHKAFKSCKELSTCEFQDGEYFLQLQFPKCTKSVRVYCADMDTSDPKEYITLKSENNFSHLDNTMSPQVYNHYGSTTNFSKIRVAPDLQVVTTNHRFAQITWNNTMTIFEKYGSAGDCIDMACKTSKIGKFKMDLKNTGFQFVTPIKWGYIGWPVECAGEQPLNYKVDGQNQVVSGNCGSRCGGCNVEDLYVKIEGC